MRTSATLLALCTTLLAACAAGDTAPGATAAGTTSAGTTGSGAAGGAGGAGGGTLGTTTGGPPTGARYTGTVWGPHPDGKPPLFPVPGAAVIAQKDPPGAIPACNACVELPSGAAFTYSEADGTFALDVAPGSTFYLVVEKGQFRRVRQLTAPTEAGVYPLGAEYTALPNRTDASLGDTIPRLALVYGDYDHIEDVLAKVGIGQADSAYGHTWGSEAGHFDVYNNGGPGEPWHGADLGTLVFDPARLDDYDVILFSCSYNANFAFMQDPNVQQNLRDFVWKGGKLYVSDYAMPVAEMPWSEFAWFTDPLHGGCTENQFPPNCNHGPPFDAPAEPVDADLASWLGAMGVSQGLEMKENWNTIGDVFPGIVGRDPVTTQPVWGLPKIWVQGPWSYDADDLLDAGEDPATWDTSPHPLTLSWPYNCGRVLYTTYHTVGGTAGGKHPGLLPQEMVLFYLLMEITVCQNAPIIE